MSIDKFIALFVLVSTIEYVLGKQLFRKRLSNLEIFLIIIILNTVGLVMNYFLHNDVI